jgi:hypothetical protein
VAGQKSDSCVGRFGWRKSHSCEFCGEFAAMTQAERLTHGVDRVLMVGEETFI